MRVVHMDMSEEFLRDLGLSPNPALPSDVDGKCTFTRKGQGGIVVDRWEFTEQVVLNDGADAASIADGLKLMSFGSGAKKIVPMWAKIVATLDDDLADGETTAGEIGIGSTKGTGAVAVLSGTAAMENVMTGQTLGNITAGNTVSVAAETGGREPLGSVLGFDLYLNHASAFSNESEAHSVRIASGTIIEIAYGVIG